MIRRLFLGRLLTSALLCLFVLPALAALTAEQKVTLKAHIQGQGDLNTLYVNGDLSGLAAALNANASPAFTVWKSLVTVRDTGKAFNGAEWAAMTSGNHTRLTDVALWVGMGYDPSKADIRAMFDDIWSGAGGVTTRASLLVLWKRLATRAEKVFATGTGSDAVPATLVFEGAIAYQELIGL